MSFLDRKDNVYVIDSRMFGFEHYQSCYMVTGSEIVLVDTGIPSQLETFRQGLRKHGFSVQDISRIYLTHCEHPDHAGNVGSFVQENPRIKVFINPSGLEYLTNPEIENENRKRVMLPQMAARFGQQLPVPRGNIHFLRDGEVHDIGGGEQLRIMFTPGHQPSGLVIFEEKNRGLFINDLVGNYFPDADFCLILTPPRSDVIKAREALLSFQKNPPARLYLGHYGIFERPQICIQRALAGIQTIMDIADQCMQEGNPQEIEPRVLASKMPELEKLRQSRGQEIYEYTRDELITHHSTYFAQYYLKQSR